MRFGFKLVICGLVFGIAWVITAPLIAGSLVVEKSLSEADAIYILGGSSAIEERVSKAVDLYKNGVSKRILLTDDGVRAGWSNAKKTNPRFVDLTAELLIAEGVNENDIHIIETTVTGTVEEAEVVAAFARDEKLESLLLVTSKYHTGRAYRVFSQRNRETDIGVVGSRSGPHSPGLNTWWLSFRGWKVVGEEVIKTLAYKLWY